MAEPHDTVILDKFSALKVYIYSKGPFILRLKYSGLPSVPYLMVQYRILAFVPSVPYGTDNVPFFEQ